MTKTKIVLTVFILSALSYFALAFFMAKNVTAASYADPKTGMNFVLVRGGCYRMQDTFISGRNVKDRVNEVCLADYYLGQYLVTQDQWKEVMKNNPSFYAYCGGNCPVENVSWDDVQEFIRILNQLAGKRYRLPTEAEWEFGARSRGKDERWAGTDNGSEVADYAWYNVNSGYLTHPVGQKKPNELGLYDMTGNVWEWVDYDKDSIVRPGVRPLRGGECGASLDNTRISAYYHVQPNVRCYYCTTGFRLAISAK